MQRLGNRGRANDAASSCTLIRQSWPGKLRGSRSSTQTITEWNRPPARVPVTASLQDPVRRTKTRTYRGYGFLMNCRSWVSSLSPSTVCLQGCCLMHSADFVAFYVILFRTCVCIVLWLLFALANLFRFYLPSSRAKVPAASAKKSITKLVMGYL